MGRGTINTELGDGEYTIDVDYGTLVLEERISQIDARLAEISDIIDNIDTALTEKNVVFLAAKQTLDDAINFYRTALMVDPEGAADEKAAVDLATTGFFDVRGEYEVLARLKKQYEIEQLNLQERKGYLEAFDLSDTIQVWCADYTLQASGNVSTIEVPGEPATTLISPGAQVPVDADGLVTARVAQQSYQSYWNLGALPAWQKYLPTYRFGTLTFIDREANTGNVTLEAATSTAQNLDINQTDTLEDVTFNYLRCNHAAFTVGDDVLIKFINQDWSQPEIIGFKQNPKQCGYGFLRHWYTFNYPEYDAGDPLRWPGGGNRTGYNQITLSLDDQADDLWNRYNFQRVNPGVLVEVLEDAENNDVWKTLPLTGYEREPVLNQIAAWIYDYSFTIGIQNFSPIQIRVYDIKTYSPGVGYFYSLACYDTGDDYPLAIVVTFNEHDPEGISAPASSQYVIAVDRIDEVRISYGGTTYFHAAFLIKGDQVAAVSDIDLITDAEMDALIDFNEYSEPADWLEDYLVE